MESAIFKIDELSGKHTGKLVKETLETLPGIKSFCISQNSNRVTVDFKSTDISHQIIKNKLVDLGLGVTSDTTQSQIRAKSKQDKKASGKKGKPIQPFPNQNPNSNHNTIKEALGPNTKR